MPTIIGWLVLVYTLSLAITLAVFANTAFRREVPGTGMFALIMLGEAIWITGTICELLSPSLAAKLFWDNVQYVPTAAIPIGLLAFSLVYRNRLLRRGMPWLIGLSLVMLVMLAAVLSNGFQGGLRPGAQVITVNRLDLLVYPFNAYDWLISGFAYLITLSALGILLRTALHQPAQQRRQTFLIMAGYGLPLAATMLSLAGVSIGPQRDHSPFFMAVGNLLVWVGIVRFQLFNMLPTARVIAVEHIHDALLILDDQNHLMDLNPAAQAFFGLKTSDVTGLDARQLLPAALPAFIFSSKQEIKLEVTLASQRLAGAKSSTFELSHLPIFDQSQNLAGRLLVLHDITERKRSEAIQRQVEEKRLIRQSEIKFQTTIDQFTEGFMLVDQSGCINEWNPAQETISGIPRTAALGRPYWEIMDQLTPTERRSAERTEYYRVSVLETLRTGVYSGRVASDTLIQTPDGSRKYVQVVAFPVRIGNDYWIGSATRDTTAQKRAQLALERYVARLRVLHDIDRGILSAEQPAGVVAAALDGLYQFMPYHGAGVILLDPLPDGTRWLARADEQPCFSTVPSCWLEHFQDHPERKILLEFPKILQNCTPDYTRCKLGTTGPKLPADQRLVVALRSEDHLLGMLHLCIDQPLDFTTEMIEIVTEASDQLAIALNQETLRDQTRRRVHELTALHDIALLLNYQHSAVDPLGELTERIAHLIGARRCLLVLRSDDDHYEGYYPAFGFSQEEVAMIRWQPVQEERSFSLWTRGYAIANQAEDLENAPRGLFVRLHAENLLAISLWKEERILGILVAIDKPGGYHPEDYQLLSVVASQAAQLIINTRLFNELSNAYDATIKGWSKALELRERETQNHSERVTSLARKLAQRLKLEETELEDFSRGVLLHDIGKMGIPDDILLKAGPLEPDQWAIMRQHPGMAYNLLKNISFLHKALDVPYCHHERWDGSGYPRGLKGEEIPITARLFAVVDVWDALTNDRVYRRAWSDAETAAYLRQNAGILFDPKVVEEFLKMMEG